MYDVDLSLGLGYGMEMIPLMKEAGLKPSDFVGQFIQHFAKDGQDRVNKMGA